MPVTLLLMLRRSFLLAAFSVWLPFATTSGRAGDWLHLGPLFDRFDLTLREGERLEAGPFYYHQQSEAEQVWAVPPLFSLTKDPDTERTEFDFVYPVMTYARFGEQYRWQFFQLLSLGGGETQTETERNRFTIFPIFFMQRSSDTNENYTAYGPFYGQLKNRLMRDQIDYVMFPFYSKTRKKDVVTRNYVYPFVHVREGDGLQGWQVWPLAGREHKEITWRTNRFDEVETIPGHDKLFVLWPLFHNQHRDLGGDNPTREQALLPLYDVTRSPRRDSTTALWPFFSWIEEREKKYHEWQGPWPFVVLARGEGKHTTRVWPLFGRARSETLGSDFYIWPLYTVKRAHAPPLERRRSRVMFFLYSNLLERNTETGTARHRIDLWPLYLKRTEHDGNVRVQIPALLESFLPGNHKIERDYSPVWSFWRSEHNPKTGAHSQSLLWNLYRRDARPGEKNISAFFGLYQYHAGARGKERRLFFIPFSRNSKAADE